MKKCLISFLLLACSTILPGQISQEKLDKLAEKYAYASFQRFYELLSLPNDAHYPEAIMKNVEWCEAAFQERAFKTKRLATETVPLLLAERKVNNPQKTVLIYLQLDGQPVDPTRWNQEDPFRPALKERNEEGVWETIPFEKIHQNFDPEWRIFARSASDAKGPVSMFLAALDAIQELQVNPTYNIKVIMDFEEEMGSPRLPEAVKLYSEALAADLLIIFDGPRHISNQPTLKFGARGIATITLTAYGPRVPQHSGHYGNYAPNPAVRLCQLIASMKTKDGKVTIPGFYDGIEFDENTQAIMAAVPDDEEMIMDKVGIARPDAVGSNYQEAIQYPSLNVRGLRAGWVGSKVRTIIPATATAEIDVRLVKECDPERLIELIRNHIVSQGYKIMNRAPTDEERKKHDKMVFFRSAISYQAFRTPINSEVGNWLSNAMKKAFGKAPIKIRTSGGSIPISPFVVTLDIPAVSVPTVNMDNNQHSPNENIRLGNYQDGIKTMIAILMEPF